VAGDPALEQRFAAQAVAAGGGRGLADVVRLHRTVGDHGIRALPERVADQELELAGLVAAGREAGAVVALDEEGGTPEQPGEVGHRLERGRQMREVDAGEAGEVHGPVQRLQGKDGSGRCGAAVQTSGGGASDQRHSRAMARPPAHAIAQPGWLPG
jgi:hypothetical protein